MREKIPQADIGVIIGRFQVPDLHEGHRGLIDEVRSRHKKVIIMLGSTPGLLVTKNNPLDFQSRALMFKEVYPDLIILPLHDMPSDTDWSKSIDCKIKEVYELGSVILYGSRDSFVPHYKGAHRTITLESSKYMSGSDVRKLVSAEARASAEFRRGVVYASYSRHPVAYPTVDVAIWDSGARKILLGRKHRDEGKWRFVGGFVDPRKDKSQRDAAYREVREETGGNLTVEQFDYIGSTHIEDWRYRQEQDCILTTFFLGTVMYGHAEAGDDLDEVKWFDIKDIQEGKVDVVKEHMGLMELMLKYMVENDMLKPLTLKRRTSNED